MYQKRYNLKELQRVITGLLESGRKFLTIEDLLMEIGCDILDINEYYIKKVRHHIRYEREK
jgi:hypothetical protein